MERLLESRRQVSLLGSFIFGSVILLALPFPTEDPLLRLVQAEKEWVFFVLALLYHSLLFTTPYIFLHAGMSLVYVLKPTTQKALGPIVLPPFPEATGELRLVIGEVHNERSPDPVANPNWLMIAERGLFTGIAIFGAIGSGKTTCCMHPFADQILSFGKSEERIGGLVLEVKGDFCHRVREILEIHGRAEDYIEINLVDSPYRYNPLQNDLDAYALAYGIASLLNSLFGKGREPFWQQAYTNMVKFIILLHRILFDYVTLLDIYECAINPELLLSRIKLAEGKRPVNTVFR